MRTLINTKQKNQQKKKQIKLYSQMHKDLKRKSFVKIILKPETDPVSAITFDPNTLKDRITELKKQARPRLKWAELTLREIWIETDRTAIQWEEQLDINNLQHMELLSTELTKIADKFNIIAQ